MRHRSKATNARLQSSSRTRLGALAGSSSMALACTLRRTAVVGTIGCILLLVPDNQLNASAVADKLNTSYKTAEQLLTPEAGAPFLTVKLVPTWPEAAVPQSRKGKSRESKQGPELVLLHHDHARDRLELAWSGVSATGLDLKEAYSSISNLPFSDLAPKELLAHSAAAIDQLSVEIVALIDSTSEMAQRSAGVLMVSANNLSLGAGWPDVVATARSVTVPADLPSPWLPKKQDAIPVGRQPGNVSHKSNRAGPQPEIIRNAERAVSRHEADASFGKAAVASFTATTSQSPMGISEPDPGLQDAWIILAASRGKEDARGDGSVSASSPTAFSEAHNLSGVAAGSGANGMASAKPRPLPRGETFDGWNGEAAAIAGASGEENVAAASDAPGAVLTERQGAHLVKLAALFDMVRDQFDNDELERLQHSPALQQYVSLDQISASGIPLVYDQANKQLALESNFAQSSAGLGGGTQSQANSSLSGLASGSAHSLDASASVGFDSNPFLSDRQSPEVASFRLQLAPTIERSTARTSIRATGRIQHVEYLGEYRSLQNLGADIAATHRLTERLDINAGVLFRSDILATDLANPLIDTDNSSPTLPVTPGSNDVTVLGERQRREQYGADAGLKYTPSERDEIRWSAAFRADRFATNELSDSNFYSQQLRFSRQLNGTIGIGAVVNASIIDFTSAAFGDTQTVTPQALVTARLSERLNATGSFGVAISRVELPTGNETNTAFAGNLSLCYDAALSRLCLNGSRQVLPSAIGGARIQSTGGLSYSLRLSERDTLQFGGNYSTASQPLATTGDDFESINAFGRYERRINERMRLQASMGYLNTSGNNRIEASNFQALVGVSIKLGRNK